MSSERHPIAADPRYGVPLLCTALGGVAVLILSQGGNSGWAKALTIYCLAVLAFLHRWTVWVYGWKGRRDLFHPLVYVAVFQAMPMTLIKGLSIASGGASSVAWLLGSEFETYFALALATAC